MNMIDDYFESIKSSLSDEEIIIFDKFITILNSIDSCILSDEGKLTYLNKFTSYTGEPWEVESKRNFEILKLSSLVSYSKKVGK